VRRNISTFGNKEYDVVVVGGGIFGICATWEAISRGLSVALVEQGDFAHATSANCFKIVHGGIRYLQHADIVRVRESSRERSAFLRIAPHLVKPLPILIPTYGHGMQGKEILKTGMTLYDLVTFDRNRGLKDAARQIPGGHALSRDEVLNVFPGLESGTLTGGGVMYDGQMYSPSRLALAFVHSAVNHSADVANYVQAEEILCSGNHVLGISAKDTLTGESFDIRGKIVLNTAGPWAEHFLSQSFGNPLLPKCTFSRDAYFVVNRPFPGPFALAIQGNTKDPDAVISRKKRHLFLVPWREYTLVGVWHVVHSGLPGEFTVTRTELQEFLDEVNEGYPPLHLTLDDVSLWNAGLVLFGDNKAGAKNLSYGKRSLLIDHSERGGIHGLISLIGVRYTMARAEGVKAINLVAKKLGKSIQDSRTAEMPIHGGHIENFDKELVEAVKNRDPKLSETAMRALFHNHGSNLENVLKYFHESAELGTPLGQTAVLKAEVVHAVREEMACHLGDVVFRRTDLGTGSYPGDEALHECAQLMEKELRWSQSETSREVSSVKASFPISV